MNQEIANIVKALALTENGGRVDVGHLQKGKTGELKSLFQFTPDTWKAYAKQTSGKDNLPLTPQNESMVAYHKVGDWLEKGYTPLQIASMWNAGPGEPNAYEGKFSSGHPSSGVNAKYGVKFDVPGYVSKFQSYLGKLGNENNGGNANQMATQQTAQPQPQKNPITPTQQSAPRGALAQGLVSSLTPKI